MASRRYRSQRTHAGQVDHLVKRLSYIEKRPTPKKLLARVVTTAKISPAAVTAPKLADNAVTSNAIAPEAVTNAEIAANAVGSYNIIPGSIQASDIGFTASDIGASTSLFSDTPPVDPAVGDLWFDSSKGNKLSRWNGTAWITVQDTAIAAANAAATAAANAAVAANVAANAAQTTANSKNRIIRATTDATGTSDATGAFKSGDIWWKMDSTSATANVTGQWTFDGTKWNVNTITNAVIANLDAAKITAGYIAAGRIDANTITANMISANAITASKIAANSITASVIVAGTIVADNIAANAVTATKLTADAIDGKTITGAIIQSTAIPGVSKSIFDSQGYYAYKYSGGALYGSIYMQPGSAVYAYDGSLGPYPLQSTPALILQNNRTGAYSGYSALVTAKAFTAAADGADNFVVSLLNQNSLTSPTDAGSMGIIMEARNQYLYIVADNVGIISGSAVAATIKVNGSASGNLTGNQYMMGQGGYTSTDGSTQTAMPTLGVTTRQIGWFSGTVTSVAGGLPGDIVFGY